VIAWATLLPDSNPPLASHWCLVCGSQGWVDALLNLLLFVPLGCGLALAGVRARSAVLAMFAFSTLIEFSQLVLIAGRDATLGDVITNTIGGGLGFAITRHFAVLARPSFKAAVGLASSWSLVWLALQAVSSFGFALAIPSANYYGQIARRLGNFEQYRGRVLTAAIGPMSIPDRRLENSAALKAQLDASALLTTAVLPEGPTSRIAPIVRIVDTAQKEVALIGQLRNDAVFAVRTGAAEMRVRPPVFGLAQAFERPRHNASGVDTVIVSAAYSPIAGVYMATTEHKNRLLISASLGWALLAPGQWLIEGGAIETILRAVWVAWMLLPLAYWLARVRRGSTHTGRSGIVAVLWCAAAVWFGMTAIPKLFGVGGATALDWASALVGVLVGAWVERLALGDANEG